MLDNSGTSPEAPVRAPHRSRLLATSAAVALMLGGVATLKAYADQGPLWPNGSAQALDLSNKAGQNTVALPDFTSLAQSVKPAVVSVRVKATATGQEMINVPEGNPLKGSPFERFFDQFGNGEQGAPQPKFAKGQGSGFFISNDGYLVTNNHVVDKAVDIEVVLDDGTSLPAKVIGTDRYTDLALLKVSGRSDFPFVKLADTAPAIGSWVVAMGNPYGFGGSVTAGIVSAHGRDLGNGPYDNFIQIDAAINRGNSGGPTFNLNGQVIGVNTAIYSPNGGSVGIAFAIPADTVKSVVEQLHDKGRVDRGWLGVQIQPVTKDIADSMGLKEVKGALVSEAMPGTPAAKAGLKSGDVITAVNNTAIGNAHELAKAIGNLPPQSEVSLTVIRDNKAESVKVTLDTYKDRMAANDTGDPKDPKASDTNLGFTVAPATNVEGAGRHGLAVLNVDPDGKAADAGLQAGDVILKVGGEDVSSAGDLRRALKAASGTGKKHTLALVRRENAQHYVSLPTVS